MKWNHAAVEVVHSKPSFLVLTDRLGAAYNRRSTEIPEPVRSIEPRAVATTAGAQLL